MKSKYKQVIYINAFASHRGSQSSIQRFALPPEVHEKNRKNIFLTVSPDCLCSSVYFTLTGFLSKDFVTEVKVVTYFIHEAYCQTSGKLSNSELWKYRFNKNIALARLG